jgi:hypothetical protein
VVAVGGGRRVFPFERVEVKLLATSPEERVRLEAIVQNGWELEREVKERFKSQNVRLPQGFAIPVQVTEERGPEFGARRYALAFAKSAEGEGPGANPANPANTANAAKTGDRPARNVRPSVHITVVKGKAAQETYDFDAERIYLGRLEEVLDVAGRVKRRNDVAFLEEGDLSQTVSREHARIAWDRERGAFWLRDEGSASGTLLFRAGRSIEVSRHDRRGVKLENGDEVYLGRAAVRVGIGG